MAIRDVQESEFGDLVLRRQAPVLVAFRAAWCMPSVQMEAVLEEVAGRYNGQVEVVGVDVDGDVRAHRLARRFGITRIPVVLLFAEGRVKDFVGGLASAETINEMVELQLEPVIPVDERNFAVEVRQSRIPVLVHFNAAWCAESRALAPEVEQVAERFRGQAKVVRIEFGPETARLCAEWGVTRVPALTLIEDGQVVDQILGSMRGDTQAVSTPAERIAEMLNQAVM